jgi:hypothetical protein
MRQRLPNRRLRVDQDIDWRGHKFTLGVGFDDQGRAREIFVTGFKAGAELDALMSDAAVTASMLFQHGIAPEQLWRSLGRASLTPEAAPTEDPSSVLGLVVLTAARIEAMEGAGIAAAHAIAAWSPPAEPLREPASGGLTQ